jgi:hypothetical protein
VREAVKLLVMPEDAADYYKELQITSLGYVLFALNAAIDTNKEWTSVTFEDVYAHLETDDLIAFLDERLHSQLSYVVGTDRKQGQLLLAGLGDISGYTKDRERPTLGVEQSGVCLVVAWTVSLIQNGLWNVSDQWLTDHRNLFTKGTPISHGSPPRSAYGPSGEGPEFDY